MYVCIIKCLGIFTSGILFNEIRINVAIATTGRLGLRWEMHFHSQNVSFDVSEKVCCVHEFLVYCESDLRFLKNCVSIPVSKTWEGSHHYKVSQTPSETVWIIYVSI